jgi:hypothetical protein
VAKNQRAWHAVEHIFSDVLGDDPTMPELEAPRPSAKKSRA